MDKVFSENYILEFSLKYTKSTDPMCLIYKGDIINCNKEAIKIFGIKSESDIVGKSIVDIFTVNLGEDSKVYTSEIIIELIRGLHQKKTTKFMWVFTTNRGECFLGDVSLNQEEKILFVDGAHKNMLSSLQEENYLDTHSKLLNLVIRADDGKIVQANENALEFYGYSKGEILKMNIKDINMLQKNKIDKSIKKAELQKKNYFTFTHQLKNGNTKEMEVYSVPVLIKGKKHLYSVIRDLN